MNNKFKVLLLGFLLVCAEGVCGNLHVFYEQNGDCFVLVGSGEHRGVYALNNLTTDSYTYMYDPELSYGISAGQWWTGTANETSPSFIEKRLYTFDATDNPGVSLDGVEVARRVIPRGDSGRYDYDPPYIVHRAHSSPTASPSGLGNHTHTDYCHSLDNFFTPSDIPCTEAPVSAGGDLYWVTSGVDWYHARDYNVWSDYTYNYQGGWCHRVVKEHLTEYTRDLKLTAMNINNKSNPFRDNLLCADVARVPTNTEGTAQTLGECVDGCIRMQPNVQLPGIQSPILALAYSSQVKRSYLYNRPFGETTYTIVGLGDGDVQVGQGANLTCNFIGISTKNSDSNYVYLLGSDVINDWMRASNCPPAMYITNPEDLACVAVSDQWWQSGGIVYAYDSRKGKIYSFVRVENGRSGPPDEIDVHFEGLLPDKIGADGFGNLYVLKTELDPADTTNFGKDGTETSRRYIFSYNNRNHYVAIYRQMIYKTVFKRPYGLNSNFVKINNRIPIGYNEYEREYITDDNDINSKKNWTSNLIRTRCDSDNANIRTELAVINVPTPPEPENVDAIADCCGPMDLTSTGFANASPDNDDGSYSSTRNIFFLAENAPYYDANGINVSGGTEDIDGDGVIGRFPNTIDESSVVYHWKIVKTKDRFGNTINPGDPDYLVLDTVGDYLLVFPSLLEGEFDVGVKVEYRYYDYTKLKVGALASEKSTCLYPPLGQRPLVATAAGANVRDGYSWEHIKQTWKKPPESIDGKGIIMTSLNYDDESGYKPAMSSDDANLSKTTFVMDGASLCKAVDNERNIVNQGNIRWGMKLRETKANIDRGLDRTAVVTSDTPPDPNDPNMIPDTLKWVDNFQVSWKADLKKGDETIWSKTLTLENFNLTNEQLRDLMPMPSDPLRYSIIAEVSRRYTYMVYVRYPVRQTSYGWEYRTERVPVVVNVGITGEAEVCVTDNTGPSLYQYNAEENAEVRVVPGYKLIYANAAGKEDKNTAFIKASTGETIQDWNSGTSLVFYVCDNNPMANYTGTKTVNTSTKDSYHLTNTNTLRASFNINDRKAILHYDTANGIIPTSDLKTQYTFSPVVVDSDEELRSVGLVPSTALSYVKYVIPAGSMQHFSRIEGISNARLPFNYANNTPGYENYKFGLSWKESCWATYNDLNNETQVTDTEKSDYFVGNIVIKDNDRPNIFISGFQDRFPNMGESFMVPTIVVDKKWFDDDDNKPSADIASITEWFLTVDDMNNGPKDWFLENTFGGDIKNSFSFKHPSEALITIFRNNTYDDASKENKDCRLLVDVPVLFKYVMIENAGTPKCKSFELYNFDTKEKLQDGLQDKAIQYVFRKAGKYYVELKVEDDAKNWPSNDNAIENPTEADAVSQERVLRAYFEVLNTKFDYRILERGINDK